MFLFIPYKEQEYLSTLECKIHPSFWSSILCYIICSVTCFSIRAQRITSYIHDLIVYFLGVSHGHEGVVYIHYKFYKNTNSTVFDLFEKREYQNCVLLEIVTTYTLPSAFVLSFGRRTTPSDLGDDSAKPSEQF